MSVLLDAAGRRRSPATLPGYHAGRPPRNKGLRYPADPPTVEEIIAVMRQADDDRHGWRLRALIVVLWRAGLRIQEALALAEHDLDRRRGSILVRNGKGGRRREVGMDEWGWDQLRPWLTARAALPVGPLFCVIDGPTRGRTWAAAAVRAELRRLAARAGVRRRFAPHQLRHAHAARARPRGRAAQHHPAPARPHQPRHHIAGSGRGAVPALPPVRFPAPPSEPDVHVPAHPALHRTRDGRSCRRVRQRRFPVEWWLVLFRWPPTARGCGGPDSDIGSPEPRRARRASCLRGWSSGAPSTVA